MKPPTAILFGGAACLLFVAGCEPSRWQSDYHSMGVTVPALSASERVVIRNVPWDRVQDTLTKLQAERSASDVHIDDWTEEQKAAAKAKLLRGLQVSGDPNKFELLGRSDFRTTDSVKPDDGSLEAFARKIGATRVIWASQYLGKADRVEQESANSMTTRSYTGGRRSDGSARSYTATDNTTIFYPIVIQADENAWVAFFIRER